MGGTHSGRGNASLTAEFNFWCCPESVQLVLAHLSTAQQTMLLIPFEVCEENSLTWEEFDQIIQHRTIESEMVKKVNKAYERLHRKKKRENQITDNNNNNQIEGAKALQARIKLSSDEEVSLQQTEAVSQLPSLPSNPIVPSSTSDNTETGDHDSVQSTSSSSSSSVSSSSPSSFAAATAASGGGVGVGVGVVDEIEVVEEDYCPCDGYAMACYLDGGLIDRSVILWGKVILDGGPDTRGMIAYDWSKNKVKKHPNVELVMKINREGFLKRFHAACSKPNTK